MKIIRTSGHNDICGGYSNNYEIVPENPIVTVRKFLQELREYTNQDMDFCPIEDFGHKDGKGNWGIYINDKVYLSSWIEPDYIPLYDEVDLDKSIEYISGDGGWYCAVNIRIYTR